MELESEAQLLNALPPPIRGYQAQLYTLGTGVVYTQSQIDVWWVLLLRFSTSSKLRRYPQSASLRTIRRTYPFLLNLIGITSTGLHWHRHLLSLEFYTDVEIPPPWYFHMGVQQP